jgi:hypothetical protein
MSRNETFLGAMWVGKNSPFSTHCCDLTQMPMSNGRAIRFAGLHCPIDFSLIDFKSASVEAMHERAVKSEAGRPEIAAV